MKLRSALIIAISEYIEEAGLTQLEAAKRLHITQPRVSALVKGQSVVFPLVLCCVKNSYSSKKLHFYKDHS